MLETSLEASVEATRASYWKNSASGDGNDWSDIRCICLGTGRFLRSVLVPLIEARQGPFATCLIQPRGSDFVEWMISNSNDDTDHQGQYPVDTVVPGDDEGGKTTTITDWISIGGAFSWKTPEQMMAFYQHGLPFMKNVQVLGIGFTEAGLSSPETPAMHNLFHFLQVLCFQMYDDLWKDSIKDVQNNNTTQKICVINTDNVPGNGNVLRQHILALLKQKQEELGELRSKRFLEFMEKSIVFLDTMVDRIVTEREGSQGIIPLAEPTPKKALVVLDLNGDLPEWLTSPQADNKARGFLVRQSRAQLDADVALKLGIANAVHTAVAHVMALSGLKSTTELATTSSNPASLDHHGLYLMTYLDELVENQILPACCWAWREVVSEDDVRAVWDDWRRRLTHPTLGASTFFITQNGAAKGSIRFGPTIRTLIGMPQSHDVSPNYQLNASMALAVAYLLRWLTPTTAPSNALHTHSGTSTIIYRGSLIISKTDQNIDPAADKHVTVTYADGLKYNLEEGWYEFKCDCLVTKTVTNTTEEQPRSSHQIQLAEWLYQISQTNPSPYSCLPVIRAYLSTWWPMGISNGSSSISKSAVNVFVQSVATLYARMVAGDEPLTLLREMILPGLKNHNQGEDYEVQNRGMSVFYPHGCNTPCHALADDCCCPHRNFGAPLTYRPQPIPSHSALITNSGPIVNISAVDPSFDVLEAVVYSEVASVQVIDLHTHLLPPQHGPSLCLWGIDEMLTYHYLVAEFFMVAPVSVSPTMFYDEMTKVQQANLIWQTLFIDRSPISEACRGVITTLVCLGLNNLVQNRDLEGIRAFYESFRKDGEEGAQRFSDLVFAKAGVRYNVMTNIPFDSNEAQYWRGPKARRDYDSKHYKSAVRVDPLLKGDREGVEKTLKASGYEVSFEGARQYLRDWCDTMKPEYVMASTPHDFALASEGTFGGGSLAANKNTANAIHPSFLQKPGAFADITVQSQASACCEESEKYNLPSVVDESSDFLSEVLLKVCEELDLPLALKIGAHRAVNPSLRQAGDGLAAFADISVLSRLCSRFPKVRFLATFLSRHQQHEACVLASKFPNLHIYGCWWFCNNPSIIHEITQMRLEMLGTGFTCQHSDARVLDHLIYKWSHSRAVIAKVLTQEYHKLVASGWAVTRKDIRRDVTRLFGGSYEDFMARSFIQ